MATTFVVSLFLPYTAHFNSPPPSREATPPPEKQTQSDSAQTAPSASSENLHGLKGGILAGHGAATPPMTPAVKKEDEDFFSQVQPSAATHFAKPLDPRTLVRSDSHVPDWGTSTFYVQPRPLSAVAPPPDTILEYAKAKEEAEELKQNSAGGKKASPPRRNNMGKEYGVDPRWASDWDVVPAIQGNGGLTNAVRASMQAGSTGDVLYMGTLGFPTDMLDHDKKAEISERLEAQYDAIPVYTSDADLDGHYSHYCKTILWPVFHYQIPDHPKSKAYEDHSWKYYRGLNQSFADAVVTNYKRGDIIWIHDYHLCLVPGMVRKKLPDAQIGFFLHTAFPSSEVFRCLATRKELLEGMLGANLVAFQTQEYAHHFMQTCSRILSLEATPEGIQKENQFVNVWYSPIGIDPKALQKAREDPDVAHWVKALQDRYKNKRLIVSRDKLDSIRGVRQKLLAFELFLKLYPEWKDKVVMIQVAMPTSDNKELAQTVSQIVTRIDAHHSTLAHQPLVFLRQDIGFSQYVALMSAADVLMVTSLREGMNLTCHEFIVCQDGQASHKKHGPVILSEFMGSAAVFDGNELGVNPWDYKQCATAIKIALEMDEAEKTRRYTNIRDIVMSSTGSTWMQKLSEHLAKVHGEHYSRDTMSIPRLNVTKLCNQYTEAEKRLILLDYEGTLAPFGSVSTTVLTNMDKVTDALNELIADKRNLLYVMSGRTIEELEMIFGRVPGIGLISENGCYLRETFTKDWIAFADEERTFNWKESVKKILQYYVERNEHSWVEERHCSLTYHYTKADSDDCTNGQAGDCANHINDACEGQRVKAVPTRNSVIIEPMDWDKGTATKHLFNALKPEERPQFMFVAGNDRDDEVVFRWAKDLSDKKVIKNVQTVSVGNRNTVAMSTLTQGTTGLLTVITRLARLSQAAAAAKA